MSPDDRKTYLSMAERRAQSGSGSAPFAVREGVAALPVPPLRRVLADVAFVVVGGLATRRYMPERMTLDADVLVLPADLERAEQTLRASGCRRKGPPTIGSSTWETADGWALDLIAIDAPWAEDAVRSSIVGPDGLPYIDLPHLVVMKMASSRPQDLADISRMLGAAADATLAVTRIVVARHRPQDIEDLESLIHLGKLEGGGG
jgi:hypothetical protein